MAPGWLIRAVGIVDCRAPQEDRIRGTPIGMFEIVVGPVDRAKAAAQ